MSEFGALHFHLENLSNFLGENVKRQSASEKCCFLDNDIYVVWLASIVFINNAMLKISFSYKSFHNEPDFSAKINGSKANRPLRINLFTKYL